MLRAANLLPLATVVLAACAFEPTGEQRVDPPPYYREWWAKTEACSSREADFDRIEWYVVPGDGFPCPSGLCAGRWESGHRIYLSADWAENELVVRHEMLHDLIGRPGHPDPPFGADCPLTWESWSEGASPAVGSPPPAPAHID